MPFFIVMRNLIFVCLFHSTFLLSIPKEQIQRERWVDTDDTLLSKTSNQETKTDSIFPRADPYKVGILYQILKVIDVEFNEHGIPYWASFGTLLGAVRHEGIIPWDDDADVCVWYSDREKILSLKDVLASYGLKFKMVREEHPALIKISYQDSCGQEIDVDIFLVAVQENIPDRRIMVADKKPGQWFPKSWWYDDEIMNFQKVNFGPIKINIPAKGVMRQLINEYGADCLKKAVYCSYHNPGFGKLKVEVEDFNPAIYIVNDPFILFD